MKNQTDGLKKSNRKLKVNDTGSKKKKKKESVAASGTEAWLTAPFVITNNIGAPGQARWVQNHQAHQLQATNVSVNATDTY